MNTAVFKWPDRDTVIAAARRWATTLRASDPAVQDVFCVGSCARADWGVGSDIDLIVILSDTGLTPAERYARYLPHGLPVSADLSVYSHAEWESLASRSPLVRARLDRERLDLLDR